MSFATVKNNYKNERLKERETLLNYLLPFTKNKAHFLYGYTFINGTNAGKGVTDYTNNSTITEYDLSNWIWLTLKRSTSTSHEDITVYFQSSNYDPRTDNWLALFDRLSFSFQEDKGKKTNKVMIKTDIDLPFDTAKLKKLLDIMAKEFEEFYK
ncbi:hypothetical protein LL14B4_13170 (plasmid) [Lactococcus lactis subsp. lactis]|uniref:Uncharacterized protein n=1 Tax=Lactococcus lactis subsp. lactis TaxID=1360 RepID=A0A2Z3KI36_LACLL|nr:hypothetical protein [Lactococcus lactis]AWN67148.1 hypothetical protein LL14B4_13170 [Lactococcus lactis subsp. lactis]